MWYILKKQLNNWEQKTRTKSENIKKIAAVATISTALTVNTFAQSDSNKNQYIIINGTVSVLSSDTLNRRPISKAIIKFDTLGTMTKTDSSGNYSLSILKSKIKSNKIELLAIAKKFE